MYSFNLTEEELKVYITGLDSSIRLACQQMANAQSAGEALKQMLPRLIAINNQFARLDAMILDMQAKSKEQSEQEAKASVSA